MEIFVLNHCLFIPQSSHKVKPAQAQNSSTSQTTPIHDHRVTAGNWGSETITRSRPQGPI